MNIPKIIHQIWLGPKEPPKWCIDSWQKDYISKYPDWKFKLWREKDIDNLTLINRRIYNKEPTLRGKSDIARYEILYQFGGIFMDSDSFWIENGNSSLNNLLIEAKDTGFFAGYEPNKDILANGIIGSCKSNKVLLDLINYLKDNYDKTKKKHSHKYSIWLVTGPIPFNKVLEKYDKNIITRFPPYYFLPETYKNNNMTFDTKKFKEKFPKSYMYQYWLSRNKKYEE